MLQILSGDGRMVKCQGQDLGHGTQWESSPHSMIDCGDDMSLKKHTIIVS